MQTPLQNHRHIRELIPWFVTGTLDERETDLVSEHLARCVDCNNAVAKEIMLSRKVREQPAYMDQLAAMETAAFTSLQDSLPQQSAQPQLQPPPERTAHRSWQAPAVAAAVLLLVGGTSFIFGRASLDAPYQAMTSSPEHSGVVIQLIFYPRTSEQDVRQLLEDAGGVLLGNPSERGVYRIALPGRSDGREYAARLQSHPAVRWAEMELP